MSDESEKAEGHDDAPAKHRPDVKAAARAMRRLIGKDNVTASVPLKERE